MRTKARDRRYPGRPDEPVPLGRFVDEWLRSGVITPDQARQLREGRDVPVIRPPAEPGRRPPVAEALGYLGGAIVVAGVLLMASWYWEDFGTASRLLVTGGAAILLLAAGLVVRPDTAPPAARLRSALWLASTAATAGFLGIFVAELSALGDRSTFLLTTAGTTAYAGLLWLLHRVPGQQVATMVAIALTTAALINWFDVSTDLPGLGVWATGLAWAALGRAALLAPSRMSVVLGAVTALVGAMLTTASDAGTALALVTVVLVVAASTVVRDLLLLAVGAAGALMVVPQAMSRWFPGSEAAALALVVVGAVLVVDAVRLARRGGDSARR